MYHRIDGELFAVGVLDFTPSVSSSVYFFYDPKYEFLSPGTLGAIREIEYVNRITKDFDKEFKYYYMGYYIQSCQKSIYKGQYEPSYLLCPETYRWYPLSEVRQRITDVGNGYVRFASEDTTIAEEMKFE
jgi:arginine-tRNA-protein transferase